MKASHSSQPRPASEGQLNDSELVLRTRAGDVDAFGELVRRYQGIVFNVCLRLVGERLTAEDMAQETFMRAFDRLATFDETRPFAPWIKQVAANCCYSALKRNTPVRLPLEEETDLPDTSGQRDPVAVQAHREQAEELRATLGELPAHYRAVIELRHFHEMTYDEIANFLALPLSDVKSHLFRARKALAQRLEQ